jgi:single-strand DNA-binding protein
MSSANITVTGNVGTDPELKFTKNNTAFASFSLAYTPRQKQGDDWIDGETMWFRVTQWGERAESVVDSVAKGYKVVVTGTLKQSTYTAKDGAEKIGLEITATEIGVVPKTQFKSPKKDMPQW